MILVVKNGYRQTHIGMYLDEYEIVERCDVGHSMDCIDKYSMVILLGGHQRVGDSELDKVIELIKLCRDIGKPMLGICLGCQLIASVFGCDIEALDETCTGVCNVLGFESIFMSHNDYVVANTMVEVLDVYMGMPYVFKVKGFVMYGVQCHPDIPGEYCGLDVDVERVNANNKLFMKYLLGLCGL